MEKQVDSTDRVLELEVRGGQAEGGRRESERRDGLLLL